MFARIVGFALSLGICTGWYAVLRDYIGDADAPRPTSTPRSVVAEAPEQPVEPLIVVSAAATREQALQALWEFCGLVNTTGVRPVTQYVEAGGRRVVAEKKVAGYEFGAGQPWVEIAVVLPPPYLRNDMADSIVQAWQLLRSHGWDLDVEPIRAAAQEAATESARTGGMSFRSLDFEPWWVEVMVDRSAVHHPNAVGRILVEAASD